MKVVVEDKKTRSRGIPLSAHADIDAGTAQDSVIGGGSRGCRINFASPLDIG